MTVRIALDSDNLDVLVASKGVAHFTLTYADLFASEKELAAFTAAVDNWVVLIDRGLGDPLGKASVADEESFAITTGDLRRWYDQHEARDIEYLTIYHDRNSFVAVDQALSGLGFWNWVATLDGTAWVDLPGYTPLRRPGLIQCLGASQTGIHADLSLVLNPGWHPYVR